MKGRILIVDDEGDLRGAIHEYLSQQGYKVTAAGGAPDALELFEHSAFDLLITDLRMPGIDGLELIDRINRIDPDVPKIILTGLSTKTNIIEAMHKRVDDYLEKPLDFSQLVFAVNRAIEKRRLLLERIAIEKHLGKKNLELSRYVSELEAARALLSNQAESLRNANDLISRQYQLIQEDLLNARRIQQELLPREFPDLPGISFAGFNYPSRKIGGDFYDVHEINQDHLAFYIADVAGHGVGSAMMTVFIKQTVAERLLLTDQAVPISPGDVLKELNNRLGRRRFPKSMFLTAWCGLYRTSDNVLRYATGGHRPGILLREKGEPLFLNSGGIAVGWAAEAVFRTLEIRLEAGDRLFLHTDGIPDALNGADEPYGQERMLALLRENRTRSPEQMAHALLESLAEFTDERPLADDVSLLIMGYDGEAHA